MHLGGQKLPHTLPVGAFVLPGTKRKKQKKKREREIYIYISGDRRDIEREVATERERERDRQRRCLCLQRKRLTTPKIYGFAAFTVYYVVFRWEQLMADNRDCPQRCLFCWVCLDLIGPSWAYLEKKTPHQKQLRLVANS